MTDTSTPSRWSSRIGILNGAFLIFVLGWSLGELFATQRLTNALQHVAPATISTVREACPRSFDQREGWNQSCLDLLSLGYFFPRDEK